MEQVTCSKECYGCTHMQTAYVEEDQATLPTYLCSIYNLPRAVWTRLGGCPMRTHNKTVGVEEKKSSDPLKNSKRKARGKK